METTSALLKRTAQQVVADFDPVNAVVLFGSRARGTARAGSDWDIAVLLDREPDAAIRFAVPVPEHVNVLYKSRNAINERDRVAGSVESAIVRDGRVLAGEWKRPCQCGAPVVDSEIVEGHLTMASCGVVDSIHHSCSFLGGVHGVMKLVSRNAQSAAGFTGKTAMLHLGIDPTHVHDLIRLANQMEREKPHDLRAAKWAATVRSMNGLSGDRHTAVNEPTRTNQTPKLLQGDKRRELVHT